MSNFKINFTSTNIERLDIAIFNYINKINQNFKSRSQIQMYIEKYGVLVNFVMVNKPNFKLKIGDSVHINWIVEAKTLDKNLTAKIRVVFENEDFLIVNKPPGLVVHEGAGHQGDTLADWLEQYLPEQKQIQATLEADQTHPTPHLGGGMVHRLDKDTQGMMLIAKNLETFKFLQDQFRSREVKKKYLVLLSGKLTGKVEISGYQARTRRNVLKQYFTLENPTNPETAARIAKQVPIKGDWRTSISTFTPLLQNESGTQTLAEVEIFTGRMHQIRTQAEFLGFPLFQDPLYKIPSGNDLQKLQEKYPCELKLNLLDTSIKNDNDFQDIILNYFDYPERQSFYLMSNQLHFKAPNGQLAEYKLIDVLV